VGQIDFSPSFKALAASPEWRHIDGMVYLTGEVFLNPKPIKIGSEWQIIAQYPNGEFERICGF
jgi:hypothetical protein